MPKQKTHKGTAKRIKKTGSGKLMHRRPYRSHFLSKKSSARKRGYKGQHELEGAAKHNMNRRLGEK